MIYSNTKLNLTYCCYHKYGSDSVYRQRHSRHWIKHGTFIVPISNSNLGMENKLKTNCGTIGHNRTR